MGGFLKSEVQLFGHKQKVVVINLSRRVLLKSLQEQLSDVQNTPVLTYINRTVGSEIQLIARVVIQFSLLL